MLNCHSWHSWMTGHRNAWGLLREEGAPGGMLRGVQRRDAQGRGDQLPISCFLTVSNCQNNATYIVCGTAV